MPGCRTGMGTELQRSPNFFTTTLPRSHAGTSTMSFDTRAPSKDRPPSCRTGRNTGSASETPPQPMERTQCHRASLRQTMLEHEQIFKEQVRELHRLYKTQKLLMSQLPQCKDPKEQNLAFPPRGAIARPSSAHRSSASSSGAPPASSSPSTSNGQQPDFTSDHGPRLGHGSIVGLRSQELAISSQERNRVTVYSGDGLEHLQAPSVQDRKPGRETPSSCSDDGCDLDLTLSIGSSRSNEPMLQHSHSDAPSGCFWPETSSTTHRAGQLRTPSPTTTPARSDPGEHGGNPSVSMSGFEREREGLQRPAWLFQGHSLNRT